MRVQTLTLSCALAAMAACADSPPIQTDTDFSITVTAGADQQVIYGSYDDLVAPLITDRDLDYKVDGVATRDPAAFFTGSHVDARDPMGNLVGLTAAGGVWWSDLDGDDVGLGLRGDTFVLWKAGEPIEVTLHGKTDAATLARWQGGLALGMIEGKLDHVVGASAQNWWTDACKAGAKWCAKNWKKITGGGALIGAAIFNYVDLQSCLSRIVGDCANSCNAQCAGSGGCKKSTGTCKVGLLGASGSCTIECFSGPPRPQATAPTGGRMVVNGTDVEDAYDTVGLPETTAETAVAEGTCEVSTGDPVPCLDDPSYFCVEETTCCDCESPLPVIDQPIVGETDTPEEAPAGL